MDHGLQDALRAVERNHRSQRCDDPSMALPLAYLDARLPAGAPGRAELLHLVDILQAREQHTWDSTTLIADEDDVAHAFVRLRAAIGHAKNALHVINVREHDELAAMASDLGVGDWHEPDQQAVWSRVLGGKLDNACRNYSEQSVLIYKDGMPRYEVNLAMLLFWACSTAPKKGQA